MSHMSKKSIREYIAVKKRSYAASSRARKRRVLDELCETTALSRKCVIRLLKGRTEWRESKGRCKAYKGEVIATLKAVWREPGCPCAPYPTCDSCPLLFSPQRFSDRRDFLAVAIHFPSQFFQRRD